MYSNICEVLEARGYPHSHARGNYWVWRIKDGFSIYERYLEESRDSSRVFIDMRCHELRDVLSKMVGVIVPLRPTPNAKFDTFSERFDFNGHSTREAWKISFEDGRAVDAFLNVCESYADHGIEAAVRTASSFQQRAPSVTSRPAQIARRVGQATYRKQLLDYWRGCAVTGCSESLLLRSSHIKPWRDSTPEERLDPFNGLLLVPNLDLLFDCGFISFSDDKAILISSELSSVDLCALGVSASMRLTKLNGAHLRYLQYHREVRFRP